MRENSQKLGKTENTCGRIATLEDIICSLEFQSLMDDFYELTGIPMSIIDLNGNVLVGAGWQDICTYYHRIHPECAQNCLESDLYLTTDIKPGEFKIYKCKNNMWDIATPIVINGNHLGNIYMGQFFFEDEPVDYDLFKEQARRYGFDKQKYMEALQKVPRWPREKVNKAMRFYTKLAHLISTQGHSNINLTKSYNDLKTVKNELNAEKEKLADSLNFQHEMLYTAAAWINTLDNAGNVTFWNRAAEQITGYNHKEVLGHNKIWEWLYPDPDYRAKVFSKAKSIIEQGVRVENHETVITTRGGCKRVISWHSNNLWKNEEVQGSIALGIDNTDLKNAEKALTESENRFHRMLKVIPDMVSIQDSDMNIVFSNWNGFAAVPQEKQVLNTKCYRTYRDYDRICPDCRAISVLETKESYHNEIELTEDFWVDLRVIPLLDKNGEVEYFIEWVRDISKLKAIEKQLKALNIDLEKKVEERTKELEKVNNELNAFTYSVSHDLRSPLRRVEGFCRIVLEEYSDQLDEKGRDYLKRISLSTNHMKDLIEDLLKLSRVSRQELTMEPVELSVLVSIYAKMLQEKEQERQVEIVISPGQVVEGDTSLLRIAMENLLDNAWKYTSGKERARIEFGAVEEENRKVFYIKDNGIGFNMKYSSKLFTPFQRLHSESDYSGTGIGLSIVSRIINRHGGEIWAESEEGKGTVFYFTIP